MGDIAERTPGAAGALPDDPEELKQIGKDIERRVLTRAVRAHLEHRVITCGCRTIVFNR